MIDNKKYYRDEEMTLLKKGLKLPDTTEEWGDFGVMLREVPDDFTPPKKLKELNKFGAYIIDIPICFRFNEDLISTGEFGKLVREWDGMEIPETITNIGLLGGSLLNAPRINPIHSKIERMDG